MCNIDKIYALIVLESIAYKERSLESEETDLQNEVSEWLKSGRRKHRPLPSAADQAVFGSCTQLITDGLQNSSEHLNSLALEVQ